MIILKYFKTDELGIVMPGKVFAKMKPEEVEWDFCNPLLWIKYIRQNYPELASNKRLRAEVYTFGGNPSFICLFPGYDNNGKMRSILEYGKM
jgi:hypothetical protein